jgi:hypothetical protein|nr:MAG TPA: hypothetical protein [Caudoviricetes sp.]
MNDTFPNFSDIDIIEPDIESNISPPVREILTPDEKRNNREKNQFHWAKVIFIWVLAGSGIAVLITVVLHLILPNECRWLDTNETSYLKGLFASGIGGAILAKFGNKLIE